MAFTKLGALVERINSTVTSGGTLNLANNSTSYQRFTGTTTHIVVLPQANASSPNECPVGLKFMVMNRSTGAITVNAFGGALLATVPAGEQKLFRLTDNSTSTGSWDITVEAGTTITFGNADLAVLAAGLSDTKYQDSQTESNIIKVLPEEIGGNYWLTKPSVPNGRRYAGSFSINGHAYLAGGQVVGPTTSAIVERYTDDSNFWISRQSLPAARDFLAGYANASNGYLFGGSVSGSNVDSILSYGDSLNAWTTKSGTLASAKQRMGVGLLNGYFYTVGGMNPALTAAVDLYSPAVDAAYIRTNVPAVRGDAGMFSDSNRMFTVCGFDGGGALATNYEFLDSSNSWATKISITAPARSGGFSSAVYGVGFYAAGTDSVPTYLNTGYKYTLAADYWQPIADVSIQRSDSSANATVLNGNVICAGGGDNAGTPTSTNQSYISTSFFQIPIIKKSLANPTSILASVAINDTAVSLPVRLRTDGDVWKHFEANKDSVLKLDETLTGKFQYQPLPYYTGGNDGSSAQSVNRFYDANSDAWVSRQSQAAGRYQQSGFSLDGNGYVLAGYDGSSAVNENKFYGEIINAFTTRANPNAAHRDCAGSSLNGYGYIYVTGTAAITADSTQRFLQYNSATNSFSSKTVLTTDVYSAPMLSAGGRLWVQGGQDSSGTDQQLNQEYTDTINSWTNRANIGFVRRHHGGFVLDEKTYVLGGEAGGSPSNAIEIYSLATNTWFHSGAGTGDLPVSMSFGRGFVGDGYGYLVGGFTGSFTARFYQFNPFTLSWTGKTTDGARAQAANGYAPAPYRNYQLQVGLPTYLAAFGGGQWVTKANMETAKGVQAQFTVGETLYAAYGYGTFGGHGRTNDHQGYYKTINAWRTETTGSLSAGDMGGGGSSSTLYGRGFINGHNDAGSLDGSTVVYDQVLKAWTSLATGGGSGQGNLNAVLNGFAYSVGGGPGVPAHITSTYRYTPSTNTWSSNVATTIVAHYGGIGGVYPDAIFLAGSSTGSSNVNEKFNDAANSWLSRASLLTHSESTGSTVMPDGWHIVGGYNGVTSTNTHQIYKPELDSWRSSVVYPVSVYALAAGKIGNDGYFGGGYTGAFTTSTYEWASAIKNIVLGAALRVGE